MEVVFIIQSSELRTLLTCIFDGSGQGISPAEGYSWLQEEERKERLTKSQTISGVEAEIRVLLCHCSVWSDWGEVEYGVLYRND